MSYGGDPRFQAPSQTPPPPIIGQPSPPPPAPKPFVNLSAIAAEQAGPRYFGQTQEPTARDILAQRDSIPQSPSENKPYIGGFDSVPTPMPSLGLGEINKNVNKTYQFVNNNDQYNQAIQNANRQVAIDNATSKFDTMGFIDKAKSQGVTSFDILGPSRIGGAFGSQGLKIGTTTPDKALADLQKYQNNGIPVKLSYTPPQAENEAVPLSGFGNPFVTSSAEIPKNKLPPEYNYFNSIFSGETPETKLNNPTFGTALLTEGVTPKTTAKLSSTSFLDVLQFVPVGGEAKIVTKAAEPVIAKGIVKDITSGVLATESKPLLYGVSKVNKNFYDVGIGTEGIGAKANEKIYPTPEGNVEPVLKTEASQAKEGESSISQLLIDTRKGGITRIVPREIDTSVIPQNILFQDFSRTSEKAFGAKPAPQYGANIFSLEVTPQNAFAIGEAERKGLITREANLFGTPSQDVKVNVPVYVEAVKNPKLSATERQVVGRQYTDLYNFEPITKLKETNPELIRGDVLGFFRVESKGFTQPVAGEVGSKGENVYLGELSSQRNKPVRNPLVPEEIIPLEDINVIPQTTGGRLNQPMKSWTPAEEFGVKPTEETKPVKTVTRETSETLSRIFGTAGTEQKTVKSTYTGFSPPPKRQKEETTYDIISYPPGTKEKFTGGQRVKQNQGFDILQEFTTKQNQIQESKQSQRGDFLQGFNTKQEEAQKSSTLSKLTNAQAGKEKQGQGLFTIQGQGTIQKGRFDLITTPVQEQKTRPVTSLLTIPIGVPPNQRTTPDIPFAGGPSSWFGYSGDEKPKKRNLRTNFGLWNTNPNNPGEFYTPGTQEYRVSASPDIFGRNDRAIARSTRKAGNASILNYGTSIVKKGKGKASGKMKNGIFF